MTLRRRPWRSGGGWTARSRSSSTHPTVSPAPTTGCSTSATEATSAFRSSSRTARSSAISSSRRRMTLERVRHRRTWTSPATRSRVCYSWSAGVECTRSTATRWTSPCCSAAGAARPASFCRHTTACSTRWVTSTSRRPWPVAAYKNSCDSEGHRKARGAIATLHRRPALALDTRRGSPPCQGFLRGTRIRTAIPRSPSVESRRSRDVSRSSGRRT